MPGGNGRAWPTAASCNGQRRLRGNRLAEIRPLGWACSALHYAKDPGRAQGHRGGIWPASTSPSRRCMRCWPAPTAGVFQVDTCADGTLPRLKPRKFLRPGGGGGADPPGPIQGGSVHSYIRRRNGVDPAHLRAPMAPVLVKDAGSAAVCGAADAVIVDCRLFPPPRPTSCAAPWGPNVERMRAGCAAGSHDGMRALHGAP